MSTTEPDRGGPVLFCFDGSEGSLAALATAGDVLKPRVAVVLTVWETVAMRLTSSGLFFGQGGSYIPDEGELDAQEETAARAAADRGVRAAVERGWDASARIEQAVLAVWKTVVEVADEIDAPLIVLGARGLNVVKRAIIGSVSEAVLHGSHRATLISPMPRV